MALLDIAIPADSVAAPDSVSIDAAYELGPADSVAASDVVLPLLQKTLLPSNVRALTSTRIRVDFTNNVVPNVALEKPSTYQIAAITGGAALVVPQRVILPTGQPNPLFVEIEVTEMSDTAIYRLALGPGIVSISGEPSGPIVPAFFAGIGDSPSVLLVLALDKNTAQVQFTEPLLDNAALRDASNYLFDKGLSVTSVESAEGSIVTLKTSDQTEGEIYTLTARGLLAAREANQITAIDAVSTEVT